MLAVYTGVTLVVFLLMRLAPNADVSHSAVMVLFVLVPLRFAHRHPQGAEGYGIALGPLFGERISASDDTKHARLSRWCSSAARETSIAMLVMACIFPPYVLAYRWWFDVGGGLRWDVPQALGSFVLTQVLAVALPEEMFFRGYVQTTLQRHLPHAGTGKAGRLALVWVLQALLFAVMHLAQGPWLARLSVFLPGLLFGALRTWRGGVGAAALVHAGCNVLEAALHQTVLHQGVRE